MFCLFFVLFCFFVFFLFCFVFVFCFLFLFFIFIYIYIFLFLFVCLLFSSYSYFFLKLSSFCPYFRPWLRFSTELKFNKKIKKIKKKNEFRMYLHMNQTKDLKNKVMKLHALT